MACERGSEGKAMKDSRNHTGNLERRLAAYGSMSLALAAVSIPRAAHATSITFNTDLTTGIGAGNAIFFNPMTGFAGSTASSSDFELLTSVFASDSQSPFANAFLEVGPANNANGNTFAASALGSTGFSSVARLAPGALVGPGLAFSSVGAHLAGNSYFAFGNWNPVPESGEVGLRMVRGSDTFYGWADITVNDDYTITLDAFGYDNAGDAVIADPPPAPEPASIVLLALGAAGIAGWRRKTKPTAL
jgi:hypothetical protein